MQEPQETWRPITTNTQYEVSCRGRVRNTKTGRTLQPPPDTNGYVRVYLGGGDARTVRVHTLVAEAFLGERPSEKHEVNHKDGVRTNNTVENLEWVTRSQNVRHGLTSLGSQNIKLSPADVGAIRACRGSHTTRMLAEKYGVHKDTIRGIWKRRYWAYV
jgi:hypothetical protein